MMKKDQNRLFLEALDSLIGVVTHLEVMASKHLQGQHDQSSHARGRGTGTASQTQTKEPPKAEAPPKFRDGSPEDLLKGIDGMEPHLRAYVSPYSADEYKSMGAKIRVSEDGKSGYAIKPDGEFISVFSSVKGRGDHLVEDAVSSGANHLDCFDGYLPKLYGKHGFKETSRLKWDDQYAPKGWDYNKFGRPDVVFMSLDPKTKAWRPAWAK